MPNWAVGFAMGMLVCLAYAKLTEEPVVVKQRFTPADIVDTYNRGRSDALKTNPVSMELEQSCMTIWANKQ
jgi:hypothetical protein